MTKPTHKRHWPDRTFLDSSAVIISGRILLVFATSFFFQTLAVGQVGISNSNITPDASSILEIRSTTAGFLSPRMTTAQRNAISSPAKGLSVYNTSTDQFNYFDGLVWKIVGNGSGWDLTGNNGTVDGTNFIGTTDNVPFNIRVNNQKAGRIDYAKGETAFGYQSLNSNTGIENTAIGYQALYKNIGAADNTGIGYGALFNTTTGGSNTASGSKTLYSNTTGTYNTANGFASLYSNTTGINNTALGFSALYSNTTGGGNTAAGYEALSKNVTGNYNTATGFASLSKNTSGAGNTASGYGSLTSNTTGSSNTASGHGSLMTNTTGYNNTAEGYLSLYVNTIGINNTASGVRALSSNTEGNFNTAIGSSSLVANTVGRNNTAGGYLALSKNTIGNYNTAVGVNSLLNNSEGSSNTAIGVNSLNANTGNNNTANGYHSLISNTSGNNNTASGISSLNNNIDGRNNTANGSAALSGNTTGIGNTAIGTNAGMANKSGNYNTFIGLEADALNDNFTNATAIGYNAKVGASKSLVLGGTGGFAVNVGIGTTTPTQPLDVVGNIKFSGAFMPNNNAGTLGNVLLSTGAGNAPSWFSVVAGTGISITTSISSVTIANTNANYKKLVTSAASDISLTSTSFTDITELSFSAAANTTYRIYAIIAYTSTDVDAGLDVGINGPALPSFISLQGSSPKDVMTQFTYNENGYNQPGIIVSQNSLLGNNVAILEGIIKTSATSGTITIRVNPSKASGLTINRNLCSLEYW